MPVIERPSSPSLAWLRAPGSLTRHLARACPGRLVVEVVREGWARADHDAARWLKLRPGSRVWRREVRLHCHQAAASTPYVHAITLCPTQSLRALGLNRLGARPLGSLLFKRGARRLVRETLRPGRRHGPYWARRSLFLLCGQRLIVQEVFLPGLPPLRR